MVKETIKLHGRLCKYDYLGKSFGNNIIESSSQIKVKIQS